MFGFLKKAVSGLIDGVKRKLEGKPAEEQKPSVQEIKEGQIQESPEQSVETPKEEELERPEIEFVDDEHSVGVASELGAPVPEGKGAVSAEAESISDISENPLDGPISEAPAEPPLKPVEETSGAEIKPVEVETITESQIDEAPAEIEVPVESKKALEGKTLPPETEREIVLPPFPKSEKPKPTTSVGKTPEKVTVETMKKATEKTAAPKEHPIQTHAHPIEEKKGHPEQKKETDETPRPIEHLAESAPAPEKQGGFFGKLFGGIKKATRTVVKAVQEKTVSDGDVSDLLSTFELQLIQANVASEVSEKICGKIRADLVGRKVKRTDDIGGPILSSLKNSILEIVDKPEEDFFEQVRGKKPFLITFIGFNGSGKTTTIAKIAHLLKSKGISCVIAAGDTFRAAALEQAEVHGSRLGIKVIKQQYGADAAAVIFDAVKYAKAHEIQVVLADTAGRQHTNSNLMEELKKICRVNKPDMRILVVDSLSGSDSVLQAKSFDSAVGGITGIILTKVDVDEKGGAAISVAHTIGKPILFLGLGQEYSDLKPFSGKEYLEMLLG